VNIGHDLDPAAEQLYDELMARAWALHTVLPSVMTDVHRNDVSRRLVEAAHRHVSDLRSNRPIATSALLTLLWPMRCIPPASDPWWATPLGALITHHRQPQMAPTVEHAIATLAAS
jgi:hypothetical protein